MPVEATDLGRLITAVAVGTVLTGGLIFALAVWTDRILPGSAMAMAIGLAFAVFGVVIGAGYWFTRSHGPPHGRRGR